MSLILTVISRQGIIHAADSNLSNSVGAAGVGQKVFKVPYLNAALSVAGSYSVSGVQMDEWMRRTIGEYGNAPSTTLRGLAEVLRTRLESEMIRPEKNWGSLVHLAGYVGDASGIHPEFYFVRNITGVDPDTGSYVGFADAFQATEDFWTRDHQTPEIRSTLGSGGYQLYINGYPAGRIGYLALMRHFGEFLRAVWGESRWSFRAPRTLDETSLLVELQMRAIGTLFTISDYPAPYIGGDIQIEQLPAPPGSTALGDAG